MATATRNTVLPVVPEDTVTLEMTLEEATILHTLLFCGIGNLHGSPLSEILKALGRGRVPTGSYKRPILSDNSWNGTVDGGGFRL